MKTRHGRTIDSTIRKTPDVMFAHLDNGGTRFGICNEGVLMTCLDVPKHIALPAGLDDEAFETFVYGLLKPGAWKAA